MRHSPATILRALAVLAALSLSAAACGDDSSGDAGPDPSTTEAVSSTTAPDSTATTTEPSSTTAPPATDPIPDDRLPGEAFDIAPGAGRTIAVVGVRFDDVLNVRRTPGTDSDVVTTLAPTASDAVATGRARSLTESIWWEVTTADGMVGWVGSAFTAQLGPTDDITARVIAALGYTPEEATISDLGFLVGDTIDTDPDVPTTIVMSVEADETGDLAEVTFDLIGLGDDAVRGVRIHVFGTPLASGDAFALRSVEATDLCDPVRGPSEPGGICA